MLSGAMRNYIAKKRPLRPGDAVHHSRTSADRHINDLAFAAGDGLGVLPAVNRAALDEFDRWEARQPYKIGEERRRAARRRARR